MKTAHISTLVILQWAVFVYAGVPEVSTTFTYQGQLKVNGVPANGLIDMRFRLFDQANTPVGPIQCFNDLEVVNGLFTVQLDFGNVFQGDPLELQVAISQDDTQDRCVIGGLIILSPRHTLTPAPYALGVPGLDGHSLDSVDGNPKDALFVDNLGRVGVGTAAPGSALTLSRPAQAAQPQLELRNVGSITTPNFDGIRFTQGASGEFTLASLNVLYRNNGLPDLSLSLRNDPDLLFLKAGGVVGIRTSTPSLLSALTLGDVVGGTGWLQFRTAAGLDVWGLADEGGGLSFNETNISDNRLFLAPGGNVGIGTAVPSHRLHVFGDARFRSNAATNLLFSGASDDAFIDLIKETNVTPSARIRFDGFTDPATHRAMIEFLTRGTTDADLVGRMRITDVGNVGVGTSSPENTLHVHKGSAGSVTAQSNAPLVVENQTNAYVNILTPATSESGVLFGNPTSSSAGGIIYNNNSTPNGLQLRTNGNLTRAVIEADGDIGIGTTSPASRLHVVGPDNNGTTAGLQVTSASQHMLLDGNEIDSNGAILLNNNNTNDVILANGGGQVGIGTIDPQVDFDVQGAGGDVGGVSGSAEVVARFLDTTAGGHSAISIDALDGQDAVLYFSENGEAAWGLRNDSQDPDWAPGVRQFELRYHRGGTNRLVYQIVPRTDDTSYSLFHRGPVFPWDDSAYDLGGIGARWKDVWASNAFIQTSDVRQKKDIQPIEHGLAEVLRLRPVSFRWNRPNDDGSTRFGLIAQEVNDVVPDAVSKGENPDQLWGMSYATLVPILIKAIQQQQAQIESLRAGTNSELRTALDDRESRFVALLAKKDAEIASLNERLSRLEQLLTE